MGAFNASMMPTNPFGVGVHGGEAINKFMEIQSTNLIFTNVTIAIPYNDEDVGGVDEETLRVYFYNPFETEWERIPGSVDTERNIVTGIMTHFSTFGVFGESGGGGGSGGSSGSSGGGGGGGGEDSGDSTDFVVRPIIVSQRLQPNEQGRLAIEVENLASRKQIINVRIEGVENAVTADTQTITLKPREKAVFWSTAFAPVGIEETIFTGKIIFENNFHVEKFVGIVIYSSSGQSTSSFDITIPEKYKKLAPGTTLRMNGLIRLSEPLSTMSIGQLELVLKDFENHIFTSLVEEWPVSKHHEISKSVLIPSGTAPGAYIIHGTLKMGDYTLQAFDTFEVTVQPTQEEPRPLITLQLKEVALPLALFLLMVVFMYIIKKSTEKS